MCLNYVFFYDGRLNPDTVGEGPNCNNFMRKVEIKHEKAHGLDSSSKTDYSNDNLESS